MSQTPTKEVCGRWVGTGSWGRRACGRHVKADGLCAQHLAGKRRSLAATEAHYREIDAAEQKMAAWERVLGFHIYLYNGQVQLSETTMDRIVALIHGRPVDDKAVK